MLGEQRTTRSERVRLGALMAAEAAAAEKASSVVASVAASKQTSMLGAIQNGKLANQQPSMLDAI